MAHASQCRPTTKFKCISHVRYDHTHTQTHAHTNGGCLFSFHATFSYSLLCLIHAGKTLHNCGLCRCIALAVRVRHTTDAIRDLTQRFHFKWEHRTEKNKGISSDSQVGAIHDKMPAIAHHDNNFAGDYVFQNARTAASLLNNSY